MKTSDKIAEARARVADTREAMARAVERRSLAFEAFQAGDDFDEIAGAASALVAAEGGESRAQSAHSLALSDMLLAMTEPAPVEPAVERVAVLEVRMTDGSSWRVYSDGTDDDPNRSLDWKAELSTGRLVAGRKYQWSPEGWREGRGEYTALIDWPPAPAPSAPPSLWEWVRAACVSRLGEPTDLHDHAFDWHSDGPYVAVNCRTPKTWSGWVVYRNGSHYADVSTPAELTAALDRLAEEVGRG